MSLREVITPELNNILRNFNAAIKVNGAEGRTPDQGEISHNVIFNDAARKTDNPVTPIDIVAASHWLIAQNFIADFAKNGSDTVSYGVYAKGGGKSTLIEQNIILCQWRHQGGKRIGASFGGGGTGNRYCADSVCLNEQDSSVFRNNIVGNCPDEVGLYLNKSHNTEIYNNLIFSTRGVDLSGDQTTANLYNNIIDGRILAKNTSSYSSDNNINPFFNALINRPVSKWIFADPESGNFRIKNTAFLNKTGTAISKEALDLCGNPHLPDPHPGPINYSSPALCQVD
jgi:hypothetical protein